MRSPKHYFDKRLDLFLHIVSEIGDNYGVATLLCVAASVLNSHHCFVFLLVLSMSVGLVCNLKSLYNEARPFFLVEHLNPRKCSLEHGDPSAHSLVAVAVYATFFFLLIKQYKIGVDKQRVIWTSYVLYCITLGFSRVYAGVHSYN